jgi:hypothetical protein
VSEEQYNSKTLNKHMEEWLKQRKMQQMEATGDNNTYWAAELESARQLEASAEQLFLKSRSEPGHAFVGMDLYTQIILRNMSGLIARLGLDIAKLQKDINELKR